MTTNTTARIHLLAAKEAPYVAIIRRKPAKTYHIIRWDTETDKFEHGSWFQKQIYVHRSDISFDGKWMVYLARGGKGTTWNGVCLLPHLKTYLEAEAHSTYGGGGYWQDRKTLLTDSWEPTKGSIPFQLAPKPYFGKGTPDILHCRMLRDGWQRNGDHYGTTRRIRGKPFVHPCDGDDGWYWQGEQCGPTLETFHRGYFEHGLKYEFRLREYPDLLDQEVEWATFTATGDLVYARLGWVYRYNRNAINKGKPSFAADLNSLTREETQKVK